MDEEAARTLLASAPSAGSSNGSDSGARSAVVAKPFLRSPHSDIDLSPAGGHRHLAFDPAAKPTTAALAPPTPGQPGGGLGPAASEDPADAPPAAEVDAVGGSHAAEDAAGVRTKSGPAQPGPNQAAAVARAAHVKKAPGAPTPLKDGTSIFVEDRTTLGKEAAKENKPAGTADGPSKAPASAGPMANGLGSHASPSSTDKISAAPRADTAQRGKARSRQHRLKRRSS